MIKINIHDAKDRLSYYLKQAFKKNETIIICTRNMPIAEMRAIPTHVVQQRRLGLAKSTFEIPPAFYEPLPVIW